MAFDGSEARYEIDIVSNNPDIAGKLQKLVEANIDDLMVDETGRKYDIILSVNKLNDIGVVVKGLSSSSKEA